MVKRSKKIISLWLVALMLVSSVQGVLAGIPANMATGDMVPAMMMHDMVHQQDNRVRHEMPMPADEGAHYLSMDNDSSCAMSHCCQLFTSNFEFQLISNLSRDYVPPIDNYRGIILPFESEPPISLFL